MAVKSHASAVVLIPPTCRWNLIQTIRRVHDRNVRRWMPHVTLLYPFLPFKHYSNQILDLLSDACKTLDAFDVTFRMFRSFKHQKSSYTLWLDPEPNHGFDELQAALQGRFPGYSDVRAHRGGFTPHLSVGQVRGETAHGEILQKLQDGWSPLTFRADRISLIWRLGPPDDVFRVHREIILGSGHVVEPKEQ